MRVLLINPPSPTVGSNTGNITRVLYPPPPGGIASLAAILARAAITVMVIDFVAQPARWQSRLEDVRRYRPDAVGFSVLGPSFFSVQRLASEIRKISSGIFLFAGNALASEYPQWLLEKVPEMDAVVLGEGESSIVDLLQQRHDCLRHDVVVRGMEDLSDKILLQWENLDQLPFPAWQLFPIKKYRASPQLLLRSEPALGVLQSRGCPWSCRFCAQNYLWNKVRYRSMESVAAEVKRNLLDFGIATFGFYDSIFPMKQEFGEQLYKAFEKERLIGKVRFFCETRVDMVWKNTFRWLKKSGLHLVFMGIEAASRSLLEKQNKLSEEYYPKDAVAVLNNLRIRSYGLFVLGFPGEQEEDRIATRRLALSLNLDVASFGLHSLYAGSPTVRDTIEDPLQLIASNWGEQSGHDEVHTRWQKKLMRDFYLRPSVIGKHLVRREIRWDRLLAGASALIARK